jgi:EamA domain-containing membrane protein RarD
VDLLPLPVIGWLYCVLSVAALALGAWIIVGVHLAGEDVRKQLVARVLDDSLLFGIWILGLAGGIGVLLEKGWSRPVLELFCWALAVLTVLTCWTRFRAAPPPRATLGLSLGLFLLPVLALCAATILTLRSETALRILSG